MNEKDEDLLTIAYMHGAEQAKSRWVGITEDEIREGMIAADPGREDLCVWSFEEGVKFAEQRLKEKNR